MRRPLPQFHLRAVQKIISGILIVLVPIKSLNQLPRTKIQTVKVLMFKLASCSFCMCMVFFLSKSKHSRSNSSFMVAF